MINPLFLDFNFYVDSNTFNKYKLLNKRTYFERHNLFYKSIENLIIYDVFVQIKNNKFILNQDNLQIEETQKRTKFLFSLSYNHNDKDIDFNSFNILMNIENYDNYIQTKNNFIEFYNSDFKSKKRRHNFSIISRVKKYL